MNHTDSSGSYLYEDKDGFLELLNSAGMDLSEDDKLKIGTTFQEYIEQHVGEIAVAYGYTPLF